MRFHFRKSLAGFCLGVVCLGLANPVAGELAKSDFLSQPTVNADLLVTASDVPLEFSGSRLLNNDFQGPSDPAAIVIIDRPLNGRLRGGRGEFYYQPAAGFVGFDVFTYSWQSRLDGHLRLAAQVSIRVSVRFQPIAGDWNDDPAGELAAFASFLSRFVLCEGSHGKLECLELDSGLDLIGWTAIHDD